jgi:hypothetical protein
MRREVDVGFFECFQPRRATDELDELWRVELRHTTIHLVQSKCIEYDLIKQDYIQVVESRGIDSCHEALQGFGGPFEPEILESGEDRACWGGGRRLAWLG